MFTVATGLKRYPPQKKATLQAWDAADELILDHLSGLDLQGRRVLIVNDAFGALSGALEALSPVAYTDSYVSSRAIEINSQGRVKPINRLAEIDGVFDVVVARIPRNLSFFEDILCHLSAHLHPGSELVCGYMLSQHSAGSFELLNRLIGETRTSLAHKRARLIFATFQKQSVRSPFPIQVRVEGLDAPLTNHSNLFSRERLDIGTRFLLEHIPRGAYADVLDLGCGNGVVGIAAKTANPGARVVFSDDSRMAVLSAEANFAARFDDPAEFHWMNCFEDADPKTFDLVLCNPPFHQGNTVGEHIAWQMFSDAHYALRPSGTLRVIGNKHLQYPSSLKKLFRNSAVVATNTKFVIVDARK